MAASSNLALLFFVVASIYICFLVLLVVRTAVQIFSQKQFPNTRRMQVFRAFYGSLWFQTLLNSALYWVLFANLAQNSTEEATTSGFKSVTLIFMPEILMSLNYALMYLQLEEMQKEARVQGGVAYMQQENHKKLLKIVTIVTFSYVAIFILVQLGFMVLTMFDLIDPKPFLIELNSTLFIMLVFLNTWALVSYCRNAGSPYKNDRFRKYVRKYKTVIIVWNLAFIIRFFMTTFGVNIVDISQDGGDQDDFGYSLVTFANILFTEIIPFYMVLDKKIIKIFTLQFLEQRVDDTTSNNSGSGHASHNNSFDIDQDRENGLDSPYLSKSNRENLLSNGESQLQNSLDIRNNGMIMSLGGASSPDESILRLTTNGNVVFNDAVLQQERTKLEEKLIISDTQITKGDPFIRPWYSSERKFLKTKLGSIFNCTVTQKGGNDSQGALCRIMNYDRISTYQIEDFFTQLARIRLYKLCDFVVMPIGIHVGKKMEISLVVPEMVSLHDLIHQPQRINGSEEGLSLNKKIAVLLELAKVLNQFHSLATPLTHGNLNSHNVFVEFKNDSEVPQVRLGELEMSDFKRYANMFYSYRCCSVWSPPECLKAQKKRLDSTWQMDVYAFGMLMWEVLYEREPFEGELSTAVEYVIGEDARPLILTMENDDGNSSHYLSAHQSVPPRDSLAMEQDGLQLTEDLANIIRRCWQSDPAQRLRFSQVSMLLHEQQKVLFDEDVNEFEHRRGDLSSDDNDVDD